MIALWLRIYKPDVAIEGKALEACFEEGNIVGLRRVLVID